MTEHQNIEYKQSWRDEYLKWICGFANAQGGRIFIEVDDNGFINGLDNCKKLMDDIPNKAVNHLGLVVDVNMHEKSGKHFIEIIVPTSTVPIAYHGVYHYRSGSTKQELKGIALQNLLLKKVGKKWEDLPVEGATIADLNESTLQSFISKAIKKGSIPPDIKNGATEMLLKNLDLVTEQGQLTHAAILLFGKRPARVSVTASFKIGKFGKSSHDLLFHDIIETNIFDMPDKVMELLTTKYLIRKVSYEGLERMEHLEYPEPALREAVLNAIIHKDYSSTYTFLRVYDDRLHLWNPGTLPEELNPEKLKKEHSSYPRNRNIANVFFKAGYIESWGRDTNKIINSCVNAGLTEPSIEEAQGGFRITFLGNSYTENYLKSLQLNDRQVKAVLHVRKNGEITNSEYQKINNIGRSVTAEELQQITDMQLFVKIGNTGRSTKYILAKKSD